MGHKLRMSVNCYASVSTLHRKQIQNDKNDLRNEKSEFGSGRRRQKSVTLPNELIIFGHILGSNGLKCGTSCVISRSFDGIIRYLKKIDNIVN